MVILRSCAIKTDGGNFLTSFVFINLLVYFSCFHKNVRKIRGLTEPSVFERLQEYVLDLKKSNRHFSTQNHPQLANFFINIYNHKNKCKNNNRFSKNHSFSTRIKNRQPRISKDHKINLSCRCEFIKPA